MKQPFSEADIKKLCKYITGVDSSVFRQTYTHKHLKAALIIIDNWKAKSRGKRFEKLPTSVANDSANKPLDVAKPTSVLDELRAKIAAIPAHREPQVVAEEPKTIQEIYAHYKQLRRPIPPAIMNKLSSEDKGWLIAEEGGQF